jgi:hypothetical protein
MNAEPPAPWEVVWNPPEDAVCIRCKQHRGMMLAAPSAVDPEFTVYICRPCGWSMENAFREWEREHPAEG